VFIKFHNIFQVVIILLFILTPLRAQQKHFSHFDAERLKFSMSYHGLPAANSIMAFEIDSSGGGSMAKISARVDTKPLYNILFHIHNYYECQIETASGLPITSIKNIDQKNIKQYLEIQYDREHLLTTTNWGLTWHITPESYDLFSMLYKIRATNLNIGDSVNLVLHIEGQLWSVVGTVEKSDPVDGPFSDLPVMKIELLFTPFRPVTPRAWKTDLLTNRIARDQSTLTMWLGPPPQQLPLKLQFGTGKMQVTMKLQHTERKFDDP